MFYSDRIQGFFYVYVVTSILELIPTYNFSMAFGMVATQASKRFDFNHATWVDGHPYNNTQYYEDVTYNVKTTGDVIRAYAAHYWMQNIVKVTYGLIFLFWYLDHTLASNRGTSYSFYFPV